MLLTIVNLEMEAAMQLLIAVTALLTVATLLLFTVTILLRLKHNWEDNKMREYKDQYLPIIFEYLEGNVELSVFQNLIGSNELKSRAIEEIAVKLIKNVEGEEAEKLKRVLMLDSLFNYHLKQLKSDSDVIKIEGCNYFRFTKLADSQVIKMLQELLESRNTYLAFSAASALIGSESLSDRMQAIEYMAKRNGMTKMALLELFYRFRRDNKSHTEEEAAFLEKLITDENLASKSRAQLIQCVSESNYYLMIKPLQNWLESSADRWKESEVLAALIDAQRIFLNSESTESIKKYLDYPDKKVRKAALEAHLVLDQDQQFTFEKAIA